MFRLLRLWVLLMSLTDEYWMKLALEQAELAAQEGEVPVGAVLVSYGLDGAAMDPQLLAVGRNQMIGLSDPTAHAEVQCLRAAAKKQNNYRLPNTTLYVTLEPCSMCAGAMVHARVDRLVYAASEPKAGVVHSQQQFFQQAFLNHQVEIADPVMTQQASQMLSDFFKQRRQQKKTEKLLDGKR